MSQIFPFGRVLDANGNSLQNPWYFFRGLWQPSGRIRIFIFPGTKSYMAGWDRAETIENNLIEVELGTNND